MPRQRILVMGLEVALVTALNACAMPLDMPSGSERLPGVGARPEQLQVQQLEGIRSRLRFLDRQLVREPFDKAVEDKIYSLIVNERVRNNRPLLVFDPRIREIARANSRTMATGPISEAGIWEPLLKSDIKGYTMIHTLVRRMDSFGHADYAQDIVHENRYGWINDPHRSKIFSTEVTHAGVGVYKDAAGNRFVTLILMKPI